MFSELFRQDVFRSVLFLWGQLALAIRLCSKNAKWIFQTESICTQCCLWYRQTYIIASDPNMGSQFFREFFFKCCFYRSSLLWLFTPLLKKMCSERKIGFSSRCFYKGSLLQQKGEVIKIFMKSLTLILEIMLHSLRTSKKLLGTLPMLCQRNNLVFGWTGLA